MKNPPLNKTPKNFLRKSSSYDDANNCLWENYPWKPKKIKKKEKKKNKIQHQNSPPKYLFLIIIFKSL